MISRPKLAATLAFAGLSVFAFSANPAGRAESDGKLRFNQDVRPILSDKCFACHGFDAKKRKGDLRLDTPEGAFAMNDGVQAIAPGDLAKSELWKRINTKDEDDLMPPPESHKKLSDAEKVIFKRWIEEGAQYQKHWAFEAPVKAAVPALSAQSSAFSRLGDGVGKVEAIRNPIDAFIADRLQREGLAFSPEADRGTLVRRVAFAVTGLPPTVAETDAFLADTTPDAYEKMVDHFLASPRHGEEMAKHWLDVARYGDTHGLHLDNERQMWAYRDWVVKAFNSNLPFDKFTTWQLAGDLLPHDPRNPEERDPVIASGFNRCNVTTSEGGAIAEEFTYRYAVDRTSTVFETWMGLTGGCAVCHDHKFDPVTAKDFYSLYAFFNSAADPAMDGNRSDTPPIMKLATIEQQKKMDAIAAESKSVDAKIKMALKKFAYVDPATANPLPGKIRRETVWLDDAIPAGVKSRGDGKAFHFVGEESGVKPFSGKLSLRRKAQGVTAQDYFTAAPAFEIAAGVKFFAHVWLDPKDPPKAIMLQFHTTGWENRANFGDAGAIQYGDVKAKTKVQAGALPKTGEWVRLEVNPAAIGLKPGTKVNGAAFSQHGGTVHWDSAGWVMEVNPATDPLFSLSVWDKANQGKILKDAPKEISDILRSVKPADRKPEQERKVRDYYLEYVSRAPEDALVPLRKERDAIKARQDAIEKDVPLTFVMADLPQPREAFVMMRGQYDKPGEKVEPATPAIFPALKKAKPDARATRLDLANWLLAPEHPLTARVTVNRLWQQFFGTGIVKTSFDFGSQGTPPTHAELLDWLAVTFRESGWDTRKLIRLMLTSATFRQSASAQCSVLSAQSGTQGAKLSTENCALSTAFTRDPENRLYARGPRFRLDAEQLRDNALYVGGLMNAEMGGKGVRTYQPPNIWEPVGFGGSNTRNYTQDTGPALYRRSLYVFLKRTAPPPFMTNFDAPNREQTCTLRERSNTPLQALQLMNDVQHFEAARAFAERIMTDGGATPADRITFAYRSAISRKPSAEEISVVGDSLKKFLAEYAQSPDAAKKVIGNGESKPKESLAPNELAAWTLVANLILNLDETINRN